MSRYSGKQYKGAARDLKAQKRVEAEARDALTLPERRASHRRWLDANSEDLARLEELATNNKRVRRSRRQYVAQKQS